MVIFVVLTVFDAGFAYTRQYLMVFVTSKIDARLASRTFQHLLSLPLAFFEATTVGVLARNMQQTETVRGFLTGRLFQTMLDAMALPLMLVMLLLYSVPLTLLVLGFSLRHRRRHRRHGARPSAAGSNSSTTPKAPPGASGRDHPRHAHGEIAGAGTAADGRLGRQARRRHPQPGRGRADRRRSRPC